MCVVQISLVKFITERLNSGEQPRNLLKIKHFWDLEGSWPPEWPDLNPMDFFVWAELKRLPTGLPASPGMTSSPGSRQSLAKCPRRS